jgi:hypothetical protein
MGIEVDQYRESIGKYYTVARSVKKGKLLSITDIACFETFKNKNAVISFHL